MNDIFFLIFFLMLVSFAGDEKGILEPLPAFVAGMLLYLGLIGLIFLQNRYSVKKEKLNLECLLFFVLYFYLLQSQRLFMTHFLQTLTSFLLYLGALRVFQPSNQIRFLIPFALPFLLFTLFSDLFGFELLPSLLFLGAMLLFLPPIFIQIWKCRPLEESDLKERLTYLCEKAHFTHGGFKTWGVLDTSLTAAILGIIPALRYILFTKKLLNSLSPQAVEAVLAHEMGHSKHRHLLLYPLIFLGMTVVLTLFILIFGQLSPLLLLLAFALIVGIYFRYVFGFFSRLFERQADLYVFNVGVPPEAMIEALDRVGIGTGFTHLVQNWHHHSIQERIDFLREAMRDTQLVERHHSYVKRALLFYLACLGIGLFILLVGFYD